MEMNRAEQLGLNYERCSCINTPIQLQCYITGLADTEFTP